MISLANMEPRPSLSCMGVSSPQAPLSTTETIQDIESEVLSCPCVKKERIPVDSAELPKLKYVTQAMLCVLKRVARILLLVFMFLTFSAAAHSLSYRFFTTYISTLWIPNGYFTSALILFYDNVDMVISIYAGFIIGCLVSNMVFRTQEKYDPTFGDPSEQLPYIMLALTSDVLAVSFGALGLLWWGGKELKNMNLSYILSYKFFFGFVIFGVVLAPLSGATFVLLARPYMTHARTYFSKTLILWGLANSTSSLHVLWPGIVIAATFKERLVRIKKSKVAKNSKATEVLSCDYISFLYEIIAGPSYRIGFGRCLELTVAGAYLFTAIGWLYPVTFQYTIAPSLLCTPILSWVAWRHPPVTVVLFYMFLVTATSALFNLVINTEGQMDTEASYFEKYLNLFIDEIVTLVPANFMMITVQKTREICKELMEEEEKLKVALSNAEDIRNGAKLFATISHELKTPLNVIQGFSQEILEYPKVPPEVKFFAEQISEASSHIINILSDLLEHFRLNLAEYWVIRRVPMDVRLFWSKTCRKVVSLGQQCGVHVNYTVAKNVPPFAKTDECRLTQIMLNLGSNAVQYTASCNKAAGLVNEGRAIGENIPFRPKRMIVDLELKYFPDTGSINMRISDTGVGIDARHKEIFQRIFEENNESMADNELPDTQIGLNIAAEIVKKMGGIIKVDSRVGEGTEFNVTVPVVCCDHPQDKRQSISTQDSTRIDKIRIMMVEDSTVNRRLLDRMLFRLGYNSVVQASNGLEALNKAQRSSEHFDIVLLDLSMSVMDGLSFLSHVKQLRPVSLINTPIIITSGHVSDDMWDELEGLGAAGRVDKPYNQEQISTAIRAACYQSSIQNGKNNV